LVKGTMKNYPYSILVVDDCKEERDLVRLYLKDIPCVIDEACDGEDAVEKFLQGSYDIVLMDIIMPLMDGVEAISAIREIELKQGQKHTPMLSLSGEQSVATSLDCMKAGVDRMLIKPFSRQGLLDVVCELLKADLPARG